MAAITKHTTNFQVQHIQEGMNLSLALQSLKKGERQHKNSVCVHMKARKVLKLVIKEELGIKLTG